MARAATFPGRGNPTQHGGHFPAQGPKQGRGQGRGHGQGGGGGTPAGGGGGTPGGGHGGTPGHGGGGTPIGGGPGGGTPGGHPGGGHGGGTPIGGGGGTPIGGHGGGGTPGPHGGGTAPPSAFNFFGLPTEMKPPGYRNRGNRREFGTPALIRVSPPQNYPYQNPGAARDPRGFGQGYRPEILGDIRSQNALRARVQDGVANLQDVIEQLDARSIPAGIKQGSFVKFIPGVGPQNAVRLIPENTRRMALLISNYRGANLVLFSFGQPIRTALNEGAGVPLTPCYQETNGTISIDDVWVFCNDSSETYPIPILGYDGGLSIKGNRR